MYGKNVLTDDEKYMQNQLQLERELGNLRKEFLILERDQSHRQHAKGKLLLKTNAVIALYKREHENILTNLLRATDPGKKREYSKLYQNLSIQIDEFNNLEAEVFKHQEYLEETESRIKSIKKSVLELQQQQTTDKQHQKRVWDAIKTVEALENKLGLQMIKFGTICTKNQELRTEIDHLLTERRVFMKQWNSLIKKLAEGKHVMIDLIEQATIAFNQREEWCQKLQILRSKAYNELSMNRQMMADYKRQEHHNIKLEEFLNSKGQKRNMRDLEEKVKQKRIKRREDLEQKLEEYKIFLSDIQEFTKEAEIQKIARNFEIQEEYNLTNFKYIIDTIREMEIEGDALGYLQLDIDERHALYQARDQQQKNKLEELEIKLEDIKAEALDSQNQLEKSEVIYEDLLNGIQKLFNICQCDKDPLLQLLGDNNNVRFYNADFYLELLESRVHELLITAAYKDKFERRKSEESAVIKPEDKWSEILSIETIVQKTPCSLCVEHEMVSDIIDVLQHVITREKAQQMLKFRLKMPGGYSRLHNISHCQLPQSRKQIQKRYE